MKKSKLILGLLARVTRLMVVLFTRMGTRTRRWFVDKMLSFGCVGFQMPVEIISVEWRYRLLIKPHVLKNKCSLILLMKIAVSSVIYALAKKKKKVKNLSFIFSS